MPNTDVDKYMLECVWGPFFYTKTMTNLNGKTTCEGTRSNLSWDGTIGGGIHMMSWTLSVNGDEIKWEDTTGDRPQRFNLTLRKIDENVWCAQGAHGSHPFLLIYKTNESK